MFVLVLIPLLLVVFAWFLNYLWFERHLKKYPGPTPLPVLGSALEFASSSKRLMQMLKYREKYKGDFKVYMGFEPFLFLSEAKSLETVMSSNTEITKSKQYKFFHNWLGNGILVSDGDYWRRHRKLITPAFHFQILEKYVDTFNSGSDILIDCLKSKVGKEAFDVQPIMSLCTLDIMCESAMGTRVNAQLNSDSKYVNSIHKLSPLLFKRIFSPILQYDAIYRFSDTCRKERECVDIVHRYARTVVDKKRQEMENSTDVDEDFSSKKKLAFLDLLLTRAKDGLTDKEILEEMDTLLFEGHDTAASTLSFAMYCLANHQDIQERAYEEITSIFSEDITRPVTYQDLHEMKYLELVIKETLRVYPTVPFIFRELSKNVQCGDKVLPKGVTVSIFVMGIHKDPVLYPDPDVFDPDRFLPENCKGRHPYAFIPFSAGPRNCIGQKFAMAVLKCTLAKILKHYKLLPAIPFHKMEITQEMVLRSLNGVNLRIEKRM